MLLGSSRADYYDGLWGGSARVYGLPAPPPHGPPTVALWSFLGVKAHLEILILPS